MRRATLLGIACAGALALPAAAEAATIHAEEVWRSEVGGLTYTARAGEVNRVTIADQGDAVRVDDPGAFIFSNDDPTATFSCVGAAHTALCQGWYFYVTASLGDGNDRFTLGPSAKVAGGTVDGGPGNDRLAGSAMRLTGGLGADDLGAGAADYTTSPGPVTVTLDGQANDGMLGERDNVHGTGVYGSALGDRVTGAAGDELMVGYGGGDVLTGGAGTDEIYGDGSFVGPATGNDTIVGGPGTDYLHGEAGDDTIDARDGELDYVTCEDGDDTVEADAQDSVSADCETVTRS